MSAPRRTEERSRVVRQHDRARYDRAEIDGILDEAMVAHLGFSHEGQPFVIPTLHARVGDLVYVHGSSASRTLRALGRGVAACLTVTLFDGIVLSRSAFEHDVNYRSVVLLGEMHEVTEAGRKREALRAFMDRLVPGRWAEVREPSDQELKATSILALNVEAASAKVRHGGPEDGDSEDGALDVWAGHIPISLQFGAPEADPALRRGIAPSQAALALVQARQRPSSAEAEPS
jgi:nitroimidazol reductase NimA-like FMN-containing flavoprotein (pyridoxamine 5'-phosphate oxidase superfamily)